MSIFAWYLYTVRRFGVQEIAISFKESSTKLYIWNKCTIWQAVRYKRCVTRLLDILLQFKLYVD